MAIQISGESTDREARGDAGLGKLSSDGMPNTGARPSPSIVMKLIPAKSRKISPMVDAERPSVEVRTICEDRLLLSKAVQLELALVCEIRRNARKALAMKQSADEFVKPLEIATEAHRKAVAALENHRQNHRC